MTLESCGESAEAAAACHDLETTKGHLSNHTASFDFAVSTIILLLMLSSSISVGCYDRFLDNSAPPVSTVAMSEIGKAED